MKYRIVLWIFVALSCLVSFTGFREPDSHDTAQNVSLNYVLESFCKQFYNDGFPGRKYEEGSLKVTKVDLDGEVYLVKGTHSFVSYKVKSNKDVPFKAEVTILPNKTYRVTFYKWWIPHLPGQDGKWERCEKTFID